MDNLAYMERMIPRLVEQLTGERYRGQVISGCEDRNWAGWITIVSASLQEKPDLAGLCGQARVGTSVGRIWINERTARNSRLKSCLPKSDKTTVVLLARVPEVAGVATMLQSVPFSRSSTHQAERPSLELVRVGRGSASASGTVTGSPIT